MNKDELKIPTINIKGKQYATVDARVCAFRELYPQGSITTELLEDVDGRCVFKASVWDGPTIISTGHAFEVQTASYINKTSYIENCETSAVGRALGFLGIGANGSIASADEVKVAIDNQEAEKKSKPKKAQGTPKKAEQKTDEQPDPMLAAKANLNRACIEYAQRHYMTKDEVVDEIKKRQDYANNDIEWLERVADELDSE